MKRISSLPSLEFCSQADQLQKNVETSNAFRSTCFHAYCSTGEWPKEMVRLSEQDRMEIHRWKKPGKLRLEMFDDLLLTYEEAVKEKRVALDFNFANVDLPDGITQDELDKRDDILAAGSLDMGWHIPKLSLVVVSDIKSSIFAVKDRAESLQLHGYGLAYAKKVGATKYLTSIWDASDGKYYINNRVIELDSFEGAEIQERIRLAATNVSDKFTKGTHCSGCWKRDSCSAHLVDLGEGNRFSKLFDGTTTEADIREALVAAKSLGELANKVSERCKDWVKQHGPVRSEDGKKEWSMSLRSGRKSLDQERVARDLDLDDLSKYMKSGEDYSVFDWRIRREVKE